MGHRPIAKRLALALALVQLQACDDDETSDDSAGSTSSNTSSNTSAAASSSSSGGMETGTTTGAADPCGGECAEGQVCEEAMCMWPFDCPLTCTSIDAGGTCYCQTTCTGTVEIFTCNGDGTCTCQGGDRPSKEIEAVCTNEDEAAEIYYRCHRT